MQLSLKANDIYLVADVIYAKSKTRDGITRVRLNDEKKGCLSFHKTLFRCTIVIRPGTLFAFCSATGLPGSLMAVETAVAV
jgi:hypothetical protein